MKSTVLQLTAVALVAATTVSAELVSEGFLRGIKNAQYEAADKKGDNVYSRVASGSKSSSGGSSKSSK
eukprot:CAMPEP_0183726432 /NCGR_PEP_ID=MMETSP0737-20130205/23167_1 /TAXON_ID=385413 /ORGANISM="Thalassiosira miniscula, Strain CCMP1093" /LENGTH=67 /DNA_ID=CAMNT_0025957765 /DNA_START=99 /DNA_END=299 /DNA_ORIENTATION=-